MKSELKQYIALEKARCEYGIIRYPDTDEGKTFVSRSSRRLNGSDRLRIIRQWQNLGYVSRSHMMRVEYTDSPRRQFFGNRLTK